MSANLEIRLPAQLLNVWVAGSYSIEKLWALFHYNNTGLYKVKGRRRPTETAACPRLYHQTPDLTTGSTLP